MANENKIVTFNNLKKYNNTLGKKITTNTNNLYNHILTIKANNSAFIKFVLVIPNSSNKKMTITDIENYFKDNFGYVGTSAIGNNYTYPAFGSYKVDETTQYNIIGIFYNTTEGSEGLTLVYNDLNASVGYSSLAMTQILIMKEVIVKIAVVNKNPSQWQDDEPYTAAPEDTDTLSNVDLENSKVKKITFGNLFSWISNKLASLFDAKADKSTTLSGYGITDAYTKTETDNKFQDKIADSDETSDLNDNSKFSLVDSAAKTNKKWALSSLWTYIKGKITSIYYPVGTVIFNTGTNPSSTFGGTWSLYATGGKALYLDRTAGTTVNEELPNPSITLANNGKKTIGTSGKGNILVMKYNSTAANAWGIDYGSKQYRTEEELSVPIETASNHSHTVTIGNSTYKTGGKVKAEGITICAWKRTA